MPISSRSDDASVTTTISCIVEYVSNGSLCTDNDLLDLPKFDSSSSHDDTTSNLMGDTSLAPLLKADKAVGVSIAENKDDFDYEAFLAYLLGKDCV